MAFDGFIKISKIEGESSDAKHAGWKFCKPFPPRPAVLEVHRPSVPISVQYFQNVIPAEAGIQKILDAGSESGMTKEK